MKRRIHIKNTKSAQNAAVKSIQERQEYRKIARNAIRQRDVSTHIENNAKHPILMQSITNAPSVVTDTKQANMLRLITATNV